MWEMLVIAFFVAVIEKTGFLLTEDIEDIIYVKEPGEESTVKHKQGNIKEEQEFPQEELKPNKPKPSIKQKKNSVVVDDFGDVLQQNINAVTDDFDTPSLSLEDDSIEDFASELLKDIKKG